MSSLENAPCIEGKCTPEIVADGRSQAAAKRHPTTTAPLHTAKCNLLENVLLGDGRSSKHLLKPSCNTLENDMSLEQEHHPAGYCLRGMGSHRESATDRSRPNQEEQAWKSDGGAPAPNAICCDRLNEKGVPQQLHDTQQEGLYKCLETSGRMKEKRNSSGIQQAKGRFHGSAMELVGFLSDAQIGRAHV